MHYYDAKQNWRKIKRHIDKPSVQAVLVRDFNKFTFGRWRQQFTAGRLPTEFESCDWQEDRRGKGRPPAFWRYTKHAACHWLVNFNLVLAQHVLPHRAWRIITSDRHSAVWDGEQTLFDFNFQAFGVPAEESFSLANERELPVGRHLKVYFAEHYTEE